GVVRGAIGGGIGLALVPEETPDGHRCERRDHAVVERGWLPGLSPWMPRMFRKRLAGSFGGFVCALLRGDGGVEIGLLIGEVCAAGDGGQQVGACAEGVQ